MNQRNANTDYTEIIKETAQMLYQARRSGETMDRNIVAELYGIYYNAFAGALRSGVMYSKEIDTDGYPKIVIAIGNTMYPCKDIALRDILAEDYDKYTKYPYRDTSASFVQHYIPKISSEGHDEYKESVEEDILDGNGSQKGNKEEALLRAKNRELLKDARDFQYDPDYDHYYSDRLPEILKELDSGKKVIAARVFCICFTALGIFTTLLFL